MVSNFGGKERSTHLVCTRRKELESKEWFPLLLVSEFVSELHGQLSPPSTGIHLLIRTRWSRVCLLPDLDSHLSWHLRTTHPLLTPSTPRPLLLLCFNPLMAESTSSPVTADFSSAPPKRTKIVLLGDQSVGKTSLITRYIFCFLSGRA